MSETKDTPICSVCNQPIEMGEYKQWLHINEPSIYTPSHRAKFEGII